MGMISLLTQIFAVSQVEQPAGGFTGLVIVVTAVMHGVLSGFGGLTGGGVGLMTGGFG